MLVFHSFRQGILLPPPLPSRPSLPPSLPPSHPAFHYHALLQPPPNKSPAPKGLGPINNSLSNLLFPSDQALFFTAALNFSPAQKLHQHLLLSLRAEVHHF